MKTPAMYEFVDETIRYFAFLRHRPSEVDIETAMDTPLDVVRRQTLDAIEGRVYGERFENAICGLGKNPALSDVARVIHAIRNPRSWQTSLRRKPPDDPSTYGTARPTSCSPT